MNASNGIDVRRRVFLPAALVGTVLAFVGFWRTFGPIRDLVFFTPFLAAGWIYRRRPEIHKRMMLVALLLGPAVGRMTFLGFPVALWKYMLIWPLPIYLAMVRDFRTKRTVHPVYVIGIAAMLTMRLVLPLNTSAAWHAVAAHITAFYQTGQSTSSPPHSP